MIQSLSYHEIVKVKKKGSSLSRDQIFAFVQATAKLAWPDCQIAALLMAIRLKGMSRQETVWLTCAMAQYSQRLSKSRLGRWAIDKHSTGGVGDGISLVLAPLGAALGLSVPMMSGRSLGLTGGTLDKLEAIPGFKTALKKEAIEKQVARIGLAMFGQNKEMAPVDRKLYALRDAIGAVDSLPLIVSSIVSKKLIEGLKGIVFDVKWGQGAIFKNLKEANSLAKELVFAARSLGMRSRAVITRMQEPLGRAVGNALEVRQAWEILNGKFKDYLDFMEVTFELLFQMLFLAGKITKRNVSNRLALEALENGSALRKFQEMMMAQGVLRGVAMDLPSYLPKAKKVWEIQSPREGWVEFIDAQKIADATCLLGTLRCSMEDRIDYAAGIWLIKKTGERVFCGEPIARVYTRQPARQECRIIEITIREAFSFSQRKPRPLSLIMGNAL